MLTVLSSLYCDCLCACVPVCLWSCVQVLGWKAQLDIDDICRDAWKFQSNNPNGYE